MPNRKPAPYTALATISLSLSVPATIHSGAVLYQTDETSVWREVTHDLVVPPQTFVRYGSVLTAEWGVGKLKKLLRMGYLVPHNRHLHFDLERVFNSQYIDDLGKPHRLDDLLRFFGINTLEEVATRKPGYTPYSEGYSPTHQPQIVRIETILREAKLSMEQIERLIASAQLVIQNDATKGG